MAALFAVIAWGEDFFILINRAIIGHNIPSFIPYIMYEYSYIRKH